MYIDDFLAREELTLASIQKRAVAMFIDIVVLAVLMMIIEWERMSVISPSDMMAWQEELVMLYLPLAFVYQLFFVKLYGATLGKMVMKIRIISLSTGDTPTFPEALNRSLIRLVSELALNLGFLWGVLDPYRQAWHDKSAKTVVIDA